MAAADTGRWQLWADVENAVRAAFPGRDEALLAALEVRLEPGPWSTWVKADAAGGWTRDRLLPEIARALVAADADRADTQVRALERWLTDSALTELAARLGLRGIVPDTSRVFSEWAATALEAGLDTPSLRILAGLTPGESRHEEEEWLRRAMRELSFPRDDGRELRAAALFIAREVVQGRIDAAEAARRLYDIAVSLPPGDGDLVLWRRMRWEFDMDWTTRSLEEYQREVVEAAKAMLGAPAPEED